MKYGFYDEEYDDGTSCKTLMTGDGKSMFTDLNFSDGLVGIGFSYGPGQGVGVKVTPPEGTKASEAGVRFQVKFESQESIDSMIETLLRVKNILAVNRLREILNELLGESGGEPNFGEDTYGHEIINGYTFEVDSSHIDQLCKLAGYRDIQHASEMLGI